MSDAILVAAVTSIGPTLVGAAALVAARGAKREASQANRAVNHQGADAPTLVEKVDRIDQNVGHVRAEQQALRLEVRNHLAWHKRQEEK